MSEAGVETKGISVKQGMTVQRHYGEAYLDSQRLNELWREFEIISHFPKPGIAFVNPDSVFAKGRVRAEVQQYFNSLFDPESYDVVLGVAIRGVGLAASLADNSAKDLVIARKPDANGESKILPANKVRAITSSEYGEDVPLEFDGRYITIGQRVLIVDDLFATGGTVAGLTQAIAHKCGAKVVGVAVWTKLDYLSAEVASLDFPVRALFHQHVKPTLPEDTNERKSIRCSL